MAEIPAVASSTPRERLLNVLMSFSGTPPLRLWSGFQTLVYNNRIYTGVGSILEVTQSEQSVGQTVSPVTLSFNSLHPSIRRIALSPIGNRLVTVQYIVSQDHGVTWTELPITKYGYTSNPRLDGSVYQVDIVHPFEIAFRRRPHYWSNEDQQRRFLHDTGFAQMRQVAEGKNIRFPYLKQSNDT